METANGNHMEKVQAQKRLALSNGEGQVVGTILHDLCGNMVLLRNQLKTAHWNLRDQNFIAFHKLLDKLSEEVDQQTDDIAERARQLGMVIDVSADTLGRNKALKKFPVGLLTQTQCCELLTKAYSSIIEFMHELIEQAEHRDDPVTTDLITESCRALEKSRWLIESHLQR